MFKRIQRFIRLVVGGVKKALMFVLLVLLYVFVFGLTAVFVRLFRRDLLPRPLREGRTHWVEASGYEPDEADMLRQA